MTETGVTFLDRQHGLSGRTSEALSGDSDVSVRILSMEFRDQKSSVRIQLSRPGHVLLFWVYGNHGPVEVFYPWQMQPVPLEFPAGESIVKGDPTFAYIHHLRAPTRCFSSSPPGRCLNPEVLAAIATESPPDAARLDSVLRRGGLWPKSDVTGTVRRLAKLLAPDGGRWAADLCRVDPIWDFSSMGPQSCGS